jgi:phosphoribosylformimino-5-aminoimidazole carboxamide ribotide isomerase
MTAFRPCIDLHQGKVKQIVGGTLSDNDAGLRTNFVSDHDAAWYAQLYARDGLLGGHVILLGPGNEAEALSALGAYPGGLQVGGGLHEGNASPFLDAGASHVIVTSFIFPEGAYSAERLRRLASVVGKRRLVVDLSCRRRRDDWFVASNRWQTITDSRIDEAFLAEVAVHCDELLIHAADVEGKCEGMDWELVELLARISPLPTTYAGGSRDVADLARLEAASAGRIDLSIGSALDIFGGAFVRYADCVAFNRRGG